MQREAAETGRFITFEGGEGSGKSTQAGILANRLTRAGRKVLATREPGGSPAAEEIRDALLSGRMWQFGPFAEALLFSVARADHIEHAIAHRLWPRATGSCATASSTRRAPIRERPLACRRA